MEFEKRNITDLLPFKTGAFRLAAAAGVPIVPIVAEPLAVVADTKRSLARPGTLRMTVLEPIPADTSSSRTIGEIAALTRERMQEELERLTRGR